MISLSTRDRESCPVPSSPIYCRPYRWLLALLALLLAVSATVDLARPGVAQTVPNGFRDELVTTLSRPTGLGFTPDGRLLIAAKSGQIWIVENDVRADTPALDLSPTLCTERNRGLLGIAVDPKFAKNNFIYLTYTFDKFGDNRTRCEQYGERVPVTRVSRFVLGQGGTVDPSSEVILLDNIQSDNDGNHDAGDLAFGNDDFLYISIGDGDRDILDPSLNPARDQAQNPNAQRMNLLHGKIVRITRNGGIPRSNPYLGKGTKRCNRKGSTGKLNTCREIYASGLRNAFRIAFDPNARGTRFFINDVGNDHWEEVNNGAKGANYGYNFREGPCTIGSYAKCPPPRPGLSDPTYAYRHDNADDCRSITAGAFVPKRSDWPANLKNDYLYGDFICGKVFRLSPKKSGAYRVRPFADLGRFSIIDMEFGPAGQGQGLYYATFSGGGQVRRIVGT